jgi:hypothetical protein
MKPEPQEPSLPSPLQNAETEWRRNPSKSPPPLHHPLGWSVEVEPPEEPSILHGLVEPPEGVSRPPKPMRRRLEVLRDRLARLGTRATRREALGQPTNRDRAEEAALRWALRVVESTLRAKGMALESDTAR